MSITTFDLGLCLLAGFFALRAGYYRDQPAWKWLLPVVVLCPAALPEDAPEGVFFFVVGLMIVGALAHIRWVGRRLPGRHERA